MTLESVRSFLARHAPDLSIIELQERTATVTEAAAAFGVQPAQIAKTLSLRIGTATVLVVAGGDARLNNSKLKSVFGGKARMLSVQEVLDLTGHEVGGVCPFGLATPLPVYCDLSLQRFAEVIPAAGSPRSGLRISPQRLVELTSGRWVDVCE
jgi:prolyl-tRNA editing enzyme YbaK/EbsC (Cys-tRNA(Pro) deacylase)